MPEANHIMSGKVCLAWLPSPCPMIILTAESGSGTRWEPRFGAMPTFVNAAGLLSRWFGLFYVRLAARLVVVQAQADQ